MRQMKAAFLLFILHFDVFHPGRTVAEEDVCSNAVNIGALTRSTAFITGPSNPTFCDDNLNINAWYRFDVNGTGNKMPEACVPQYHCGTGSPIWINGTQPTPQSPGPMNVSVCATTSSSSCCGWTATIRVMWCSSGFYIYQLKNVPLCDWAYCFGDTYPCPAGQTYNSNRAMCINMTTVISPSTILSSKPITDGLEIKTSPMKMTTKDAISSSTTQSAILSPNPGDSSAAITTTMTGTSVAQISSTVTGAVAAVQNSSTVTGAVIGAIVAGVIAFLLLITVVVIVIVCLNHKPKSRKNTKNRSNGNEHKSPQTNGHTLHSINPYNPEPMRENDIYTSSQSNENNSILQAPTKTTLNPDHVYESVETTPGNTSSGYETAEPYGNNIHVYESPRKHRENNPDIPHDYQALKSIDPIDIQNVEEESK